MKKQTKAGRPIETKGDIDSLPKGEPIKMHQFMDALDKTSPVLLEQRTNIERTAWYAWRNNYRLGKMSLDKMVKIAEILGADCSTIDVIIK